MASSQGQKDIEIQDKPQSLDDKRNSKDANLQEELLYYGRQIAQKMLQLNIDSKTIREVTGLIEDLFLTDIECSD